MRISTISLLILCVSCASNKKPLKEDDFRELIGKTYVNEHTGLGQLDLFVTGLVDPTSFDYGITGYKLGGNKALMVFSKNIGRENGSIKWQVLDVLVCEGAYYFNECCQISDSTVRSQSKNRGYFTFIANPDSLSNPTIFYANRVKESFEIIRIDECNLRELSKKRLFKY